MKTIQRLIERHFTQAESRRIVGNSTWLIGERAAQIGLALAITFWVARYLGPKKFGELNFAISLVGLLAPVAALGLNWIVTRELVKEPASGDQILGTSLWLRLVAGCLSLVVAVAAIRLMRPTDDRMLLFVVVLAIGHVFSAFHVLDYWFLARLESRPAAIARTSALIAVSAARVTALLSKASLVAFVVLAAAETALSAAVLLIPFCRRASTRFLTAFDRARATQLLADSWPLILSAFATVVNLRIDQVMLGQFGTEASVGIYAAAAKISEAWYVFPAVIAGSLFPSLLAAKDRDSPDYRRRLQITLDSFAIMGIAIALLLSFSAGPLVRIVYGPDFEGAGTILAIHIWAGVFVFLREVLSKWILAENVTYVSLTTQGLGAIINIFANLFLIPSYGGVGAAVATVISYATASYLALFVHSRTREFAIMMTLALVAPFRWAARAFARTR